MNNTTEEDSTPRFDSKTWNHTLPKSSDLLKFSDSANEWSKVVQLIIGSIGLIANTVGIPLFFKIGNIFNQSLAFLAVVDIVSIIPTNTFWS